MSDTTLTITKRKAASTRENQRLRKQDVIPGVLYGQGREPLPFQIERVKLRSAMMGEAGRNAILSLVIDGEDKPVNAILKAMEIDRVRDRVTHIDLIAISMTEKITAPVPVHLVGEADGVKLDGGMIEHSLHEILVAALPGAMHVRDLTAGTGYEFAGDPDSVVCSCVVTRAAMSEATTEGEEGAEGEVPLVGESDDASAEEASGDDSSSDDSSE